MNNNDFFLLQNFFFFYMMPSSLHYSLSFFFTFQNKTENLKPCVVVTHKLQKDTYWFSPLFLKMPFLVPSERHYKRAIFFVNDSSSHLHFLYVVAKPIHLSKTTLAVGWFEPQTSDYQIMANLPISLIFLLILARQRHFIIAYEEKWFLCWLKNIENSSELNNFSHSVFLSNSKIPSWIN